MPIDYSRYPKDWKQLRAAVLKRARNRCEQCRVQNGALVFRGEWNGKKVYQTANGDLRHEDTGKLIMRNSEFELIYTKEQDKRAIKIVLTVAHLDHDETNHAVKLDRLKALCQLHHLRYDVGEKKRRRNKNQLKLF